MLNFGDQTKAGVSSLSWLLVIFCLLDYNVVSLYLAKDLCVSPQHLGSDCSTFACKILVKYVQKVLNLKLHPAQLAGALEYTDCISSDG